MMHQSVFLILLVILSVFNVDAFVKSGRLCRTMKVGPVHNAATDEKSQNMEAETTSATPIMPPVMKKEVELKAQVIQDTEVIKPMGDMKSFELDTKAYDSLKTKRSYISIVAERLVQSIDDYQVSKKITEALEKSRLKTEVPQNVQTKEKVVVLGSGWGSHAFLKTIDSTRYDVTIISPRNYFTFTPMLAASAVGTVEFRSICEPIRNANVLTSYVEASATEIDPERKVVSCQSIQCEGTACDFYDFDIPYDKLLVAVGATTNTFGIKGVREHCQFLKQIEDAGNLRRAIAYCFERASIPGLSEEEIRAALSFVVVGAGPTGVEFTSELRDWLETEGRKYFPKILKYAKITLVEAGNAVLAVFDEILQKDALQRLTERETKLLEDGLIEEEVTTVKLQVGVKEIGDKKIYLSNNETLDYGFCLWAAGNGPNPLVSSLVDRVDIQREKQSSARGRIVVDKWCRAEGMDEVYSIGDCTFVEDGPLPATAQVASQQGSYLGRLFSKGFSTVGSQTTTGTTTNDEEASANALAPPLRVLAVDESGDNKFASETLPFGKLGVTAALEEAKNDSRKVVEYAKPFQFLNLGVLAYVGAAEAVAQIAVDDKTAVRGSGPLGFLLWRGIYWSKQVSWRNRILIGVDWAKARIFGRDIAGV